MKIIVALTLSLFAMSAMADAKSDDAARSKMIQAGIKICDAKGFKTVGQKDACVSEYTTKANGLYPARGTDEYSRKHYAGLSKGAAESTLAQLQNEWKTAEKGGYFSAQRKPGVVSKKAVVSEGWWIQVNILGARQSQEDPWFVECKGLKSSGVLRRCPLGKGGEQ